MLDPKCHLSGWLGPDLRDGRVGRSAGGIGPSKPPGWGSRVFIAWPTSLSPSQVTEPERLTC
jgi:hypothetical protein